MKMIQTFFKHSLYLGLAMILVMGCSSSDSENTATAYEAGLKFFEMSWEQRDRTYQVYFPPEQFSQQNLPILFVLHGGGGDATSLQVSILNRFNQLADANGFIVVYPEGFEKQWNDGRDVQGIVTAWDENIDDVGFISEIVTRLSDDFSIDANRIFTSGISNGGFMSTRLLCDKADIFKGGAIITATISESYLPNCNPANAVSVLVLNGTEDPIVPYDGGDVVVLGQRRGAVISTDNYMQFWANTNGCTTNPIITNRPDTQDDQTMVQVYNYPSCNEQAMVQLYRIEGGGHTWPGAIEALPQNLVGLTSKELVACDLIWGFFKGL